MSTIAEYWFYSCLVWKLKKVVGFYVVVTAGLQDINFVYITQENPLYLHFICLLSMNSQWLQGQILTQSYRGSTAIGTWQASWKLLSRSYHKTIVKLDKDWFNITTEGAGEGRERGGTAQGRADDGQTDGQMDGQTDKQTDRQTNGQMFNSFE